MRRECRRSLPGILFQGDQPAFRSENMISSWLSTMSQFWHRACQCLTIRWDARYSIRRRESSLVNDSLFFVICRNWRFRPSIMFVVLSRYRLNTTYTDKKTMPIFHEIPVNKGLSAKNIGIVFITYKAALIQIPSSIAFLLIQMGWSFQ